MKIRTIFFAILLSVYLPVNCQDTVFYTENHIITDKNGAYTYTVERQDTSGVTGYIVESFNSNAARISIDYFTDKTKETRTGISESWYPNGQLRIHRNYLNGKLDDTTRGYWEDGKLKRLELFESGKLVYGHCYDKNGNEISYFEYEVKPRYPGGDKALLRDILFYIRKPEIKSRQPVKLKVVARFLINSEGKITNISIVKGDFPELNQEVVKALSSIRNFKPGMIDGEPVNVWYNIPVTFESE